MRNKLVRWLLCASAGLLSLSGCVAPLPVPVTSAPADGSPPPIDPIVLDFAKLCGDQIGADTVANGTLTLDHKAWGEITVIVCGPDRSDPENGPAQAEGVLAVDRSGTVRWTSGLGEGVSYEFALADPATDASGNIFIEYNPGRYYGTMVLRPTDTGIDMLAGSYWIGGSGSDLPGGVYDFYFSELLGPGADGLYQIRQFSNDCDPSCATGTTDSVDYSWDGTRYVTK